MAPTETKFRLSRIVVSAAVFISLCVPSMAAEGRRCYWCGPLAEQVHRSQRAPPCSGPQTQVTVCDPGFDYCAVVATSPPYIESRYCVKLYQDECYTLYCNSTRTWRMTCPCRGDLCNGPNTEREEEAFEGLTKLVAKTQNTRVRRALISTSGFISTNTNKKNRIDNTTVEENKTIPNDTTNNSNNEELDSKNNDSQINDTNTTADVENKNMETQIDGTIASSVADVKSNESQTNSPNVDVVVKNDENHVNETSIQIDLPTVNAESSDLKTEIILMSSESTIVNESKASDLPTNINENMPNIQTTTPEIIEQMTIELKAMTETTTEATKTSPTEVKMNENKVEPSEQLLTAEALQHNETPAAKTTEQTTTSTTAMSIQHIELTTEASKPRNNTAVRIDAHILTLAVGIILQL